MLRLFHSLSLLLFVVIASSCCKKPLTPIVDPNAPVEVVIPQHGAYTGAFMDFGDTEDDVTIEGIEEFEAMVGKHQAIIASSSYWGEQTFPTANHERDLASWLASPALLVAVGPALRTKSRAG